jgi:hypothetical protein
MHAGIFSRAAARAQAARFRNRAAANVPFGTNPCSEIILRPHQFCNLTEVRLTCPAFARHTCAGTVLLLYQDSQLYV